MESHRRSFAAPGSEAERAAANAVRARELAATEIRAAIACVARDVAYRVLLCGMAIDPRLVAELDEVAADAGVVLERRIREGGGLDVVVRSA
jgi:ribosomal protein S18 acetylase RimI-like enzyme